MVELEPRRFKLLQRDYTRNAPASQSVDTSSLDTLVTEGINPRTRDLDAVDLETALRLMNDEDALVAAAVRVVIPAIARAVLLAEASLRAGGLGCLAAAEIPPTFGMEPGFVIGVIAGGDAALRSPVEGAEDAPEAGAAAVQALGVSERDTVIGIAASGRTPFVVGALAEARRRGAHTVGLANHQPSELEAHAEVTIVPLVGPEVISGSTRLKSGTSQKLVLNMISTTTMIRLGHVKGNKMIDMQLTNKKLVGRAAKMLMDELGRIEHGIFA